MLNQNGLNTESNPVAIAPQVVKTTPQPASGDTSHKVSIVQFDGNRHNNKNNGTTPALAVDLAKTKPVTMTSADSGPRKASAPQPRPVDSSLPYNSEGNKSADGVVQTSNLKSEGLSSSNNSSDPDRETEVQLIERIQALWSQHRERSTAAKLSREELTGLRDALSVELHAYKGRLVGTGRDGQWAPFLRERGIPLSTADRYVKRHEDASGFDEQKLVTEELGEPAPEEVTRMVKKLVSKLTRRLNTPDSIAQFMRELGAALQYSTRSA
jgi:hypothetical protein